MQSSLARLCVAVGLSLAAIVAAGTALAQEGGAAPAGEKKPVPATPTLKAGDKAPPLTIERWVKGAPVASFEPGKVYVVEFWATWCGPCIASMPHLTELQAQHKGKVTIIGVTSVDNNNSLEKVEAMVKDKGDAGMGYTVAWDTETKTKEAYMKASGQRGIPTSFVVDQKGTLAWIGHPLFLDVVLDNVIAGKWDVKTGPEMVTKAQQAMQAVSAKMRTSPKEALEALAVLEKDYPALAKNFQDQRFQIHLAAGDYENAYKHAATMIDKAIAAKNTQQLNAVAWAIVDPEAKIEKKNLELAMKAAVNANELSGGKDAAIIDTLARVHFCKGDVKKAIELQTKAVELANEQLKDDLQKVLDEYKKKAGGQE